MKKQSKNLISLIALLAVLCSGYATVSFANPPHGVKYTPHNLSTTNKLGAQLHKDEPRPWGAGEFKSSNETEICIFCHTPHNAAATKQFLWNRVNEINIFQMYTSSSTLDFTNTPAAPSAISKMCMTCHDGVTGLNAMANPRNVSMQFGSSGDQLGDVYFPIEWGGAIGWGVNIGEGDVPDDGSGDTSYSYAGYTYTKYNSGTGGLLLNDHPISFVYAESCSNDPTIKKTGVDCNGSSIGGLPLWWSSDNGFSGYKVECVTCHDPHINYNGAAGAGGDPGYLPFLRKKNSSSGLCFTCHNK